MRTQKPKETEREGKRKGGRVSGHLRPQWNRPVNAVTIELCCSAKTKTQMVKLKVAIHPLSEIAHLRVCRRPQLTQPVPLDRRVGP